MFPDGDYLFHAQFASEAHRQTAVLYAKQGNREQVLSHFSKAADFAVQFDRTEEDDAHTSPTAKGMIVGGVWLHDGHNYAYRILMQFKEDPAFIPFSDDAVFAEILEKLAKHAK
jgi:hypothetical protein